MRVHIADPRPYFKCFKYEPHKSQVKVHNSGRPRRVLGCGRRFGKTMCAAAELTSNLLMPAEHDVFWIVSPSYLLSQKCWKMTQMNFRRHLPNMILEDKEHALFLRVRNLGGGESELWGKTAENPQGLIGEAVSGVVMDEASRLRPDVWHSYVEPALLDRNGWALFTSSPFGRNWFYDIFLRGKSLAAADRSWASFQFPSWANPKIKRKAIEKLLKGDRPIPKRVYEQEYCGMFTEGGGAVFLKVKDAATEEFEFEPRKMCSYYVGVDMARTEDFTVFTVVSQDGRVSYAERHQRMDYGTQRALIKRLSYKWNNALVVIDASGMGDPIAEDLIRDGIAVQPIKFTAKSKGELIDNLAVLLENSRLKLPRPDVFPALIDELMEYEYSVTEKGNVSTNAPSGRHDDTVISLALAVFPMRTQPWDWEEPKPVPDQETWDMYLERFERESSMDQDRWWDLRRGELEEMSPWR